MNSYQPVLVPLNIDVKYHDPNLQKLEITEKGDWIDLRAAEEVTLHAGEFIYISLGISMKLPEGYEAHILPRSSLFKNYGLLLANSMGIVDSTYCGDNDIWKAALYATRDCVVKFNDRICQFRVVPTMKEEGFRRGVVYALNEVTELGMPDRGGIGSTGIQ